MKSIKRSLSLSLLAFCFLAIPAAVTLGQTNTPTMVIDSMQHDFGSVKPGTALSHSFKITNTGTADLLIRSVKPVCGCTTSDFDSIIRPGKQGKITLAIPSTDNFEGRLNKVATVQTNDPKHAMFTLMLSADFKKRDMDGLSLVPGDRWSTSLIRGATNGSTIKVVNGGDKLVHLTKIDANGDLFTVSLETVQDGKEYLIKFQVNKTQRIGAFQQTAVVHTDSAVLPEFPVYLEATIQPEISVTPASVKLDGLMNNGELSGADLPVITIIKATGGLKITKVSSTLAFIKPELTQILDGSSYNVTLTFDKAALQTLPVTQFKGAIRLETNDTELSVINIPVEGSLRVTESSVRP
jgi:hypothetical protein